MAVVFQFFALVVNQPKWVETGLMILLVGIVSLIATYFSGRAAVDTVLLPAQANSILNNHADLALWTLIYFICLGLLILLVWKMGQLKNKMVAISIVVLGSAGVGMLAKTADYGGQLVYRYGVGVSGTDSNLTLSSDNPGEIDSTIIFLEDGSWIWNAGNDQSNSWVKHFEWLEGSYDIDASMESHTDDGSYQVIITENTPMFFVAGKELESVQVDLSIDLRGFEGDFKIVHHVNNRHNYDYFSISKLLVEIGRVEQSIQSVWSKKESLNDGVINIRVVGMNRHHRGYINDKLVLHGHADDLPPGKVGLFIQGTGAVRIKSMSVQVLKEDHDS
ncbi:MAG: hypothetical protein GWO85_00085 [Simkaniaceae bacterium]|nr:hypothetical protein [Simkaniaceae bacterium]